MPASNFLALDDREENKRIKKVHSNVTRSA
jgi:hypothetical protein